MKDTWMKNRESFLNYGQEESPTENMTQGIITKALPDKMIENYPHKKFRKKINDFHDEDNTDEVDNLMSIIPSNKYPIHYDFEIDSPASISSLLFQVCPIDTRELDLMFIDDLEKVFFQSWRQLDIGEIGYLTYVNFCINKGDINPFFFFVFNMLFR